VTPSQRDVAVQFLDGRSYRQIAGQRGTSVRTVANQMSGVFRVLGVSGRYDLLRAATL
jgi:DNA-binding CsgD family transcriptional regulator